MSLPSAHTRYFTEDYLALERESEERHEYLDEKIYAMAGESPEHGAICTNLTRIVSTQLLGLPCQVFSKDMKIRSGPAPARTDAERVVFLPRSAGRVRRT